VHLACRRKLNRLIGSVTEGPRKKGGWKLSRHGEHSRAWCGDTQRFNALFMFVPVEREKRLAMVVNGPTDATPQG